MNPKLVRTVLATAALSILGLAPPLCAHGGQYLGPGDTVRPPGGGSGGGAARGGSAGPGGAPAPRPTPGGAGIRPGLVGGVPDARRGRSTPGESPLDLSAWTYWWEFNKPPYLNLKAHLHEALPRTGSDGHFLGQGAEQEGRDTWAPSPEDLRHVVVPALKKALAARPGNDLETACMIALAKLGASDVDALAELRGLLEARLASPSQEVAETAAVSLGILADDSVLPTLASLVADDETGRRLVGASAVAERTRAFAAYGLGLLGARTASEAVRREVVALLWSARTGERSSGEDLAAACVVAGGLVPLAPESTADAGQAQAEAPRDRLAQIDDLLALLGDAKARRTARAQSPTALARLLRGGSTRSSDLAPAVYGAQKERVAGALLQVATGEVPNELAQSAVLALGLIGDSDADPLDREIRDRLAAIPKEVADVQARHFALIALARLSGDLGSGDVDQGLARQASFLSASLARGNASVEPWAALGVGLMCHELRSAQRDGEPANELRSALRDGLRGVRDEGRVGAWAIACGLAGDAEAVPLLRERLQRVSSDEARGYVAVALGLLDDRASAATITAIVRDSRYRPELLTQAAIALGLLGDKSVADELVGMLGEASSLATQASIATALGFIGDRRSLRSLVAMLEDRELTEGARAFAAVALGIVGDKEDLPWNSKLAVDLNYRATTPTLNDPAQNGILNIL